MPAAQHTQPGRPLLLYLQMQRLQNKVYRYLQLTPAQKADFARRWRGWFRRRFSLDRDFGAALATLQAALPSTDDVPLPLAHALAEIGRSGIGCVADTSRTGSAASNTLRHTEPLEPRRHATGAESAADSVASAAAGAADTVPKDGGSMSSSMSSCAVRDGLAISSAISHPVPVPALYDDASSPPPAGVDAGLEPPQKASRGGPVVAERALGERLLGANGGALAEVEAAMEQVAHVHEMDSHMHHEFVSLTTLPTWVLTEVQQARMLAAHLELGVSSIDMLWMFQVAATEQRWQTLCGW